MYVMQKQPNVTTCMSVLQEQPNETTCSYGLQSRLCRYLILAHAEEILQAQLLVCHGIVCISVEHDERKGQQVSAVWRCKGAWIVLAVTFRKPLHNAVNLLSLACRTKPFVCMWVYVGVCLRVCMRNCMCVCVRVCLCEWVRAYVCSL